MGMSRIFIKKIEIGSNGDNHYCRVSIYNELTVDIKSIQLLVEIVRKEGSKHIKVGFDGLELNAQGEIVKEFPIKNYSEDDTIKIKIAKYETNTGDRWEMEEKSQINPSIDWTIKKKEFFVKDSLASGEYEDSFVDQVEEFLSVAEEKHEAVKFINMNPELKKKIVIGSLSLFAVILIIFSFKYYNKTTYYKSVYTYSLELIKQNDYDGAYEKLLEIRDYDKANALVIAIEERQELYQKALELNNRKIWEESAELFYQILDYKDAKDFYYANPVVMQQMAEAEFEHMAYKTAIEKYKKLEEIHEINVELETKIKKADEIYKSFIVTIKDGKFDETIKKYSNLDYKDSKVILTYVQARLLYNKEFRDKDDKDISKELASRLYLLLRDIPDEYKGDFAEKIVVFKMDIIDRVEKLQK